MTLLERVVAVLDASGTPCALIGAAALAAAGVARSTFDVDLLTTDPSVVTGSLRADPSTGRQVVAGPRIGVDQ